MSDNSPLVGDEKLAGSDVCASAPGPSGGGERAGKELTNRSLTDYFRCDEALARFKLAEGISGPHGYFRFGEDTICYGQLSTGRVARSLQQPLPEAAASIETNGAALIFPFDPSQVVENLRREHYVPTLVHGRERVLSHEWARHVYYFVRDVLPTPVRRSLQRAYFSDWKTRPFPAWPVDFTVDTIHEKTLLLSMRAAGLERAPFIWFWPEGAPSCLILTHDVETAVGRDSSSDLMDLDDAYGFKASFQVVPEKRYEVSSSYVQEISSRGFEFNVHDLNHDGRLYLQREEFQRLWEYTSPAWAGKFLHEWTGRVMRSRLEPMKKIARTLCSHRELLLNYFRAKRGLSSGVVEGLNNKAKLTMRKSYGFRTFRVIEVALYHALAKLPEPNVAHRFF